MSVAVYIYIYDLYIYTTEGIKKSPIYTELYVSYFKFHANAIVRHIFYFLYFLLFTLYILLFHTFYFLYLVKLNICICICNLQPRYESST